MYSRFFTNVSTNGEEERIGKSFLTSIASLNRNEHISVWRDDGFSWRNKIIPKSMKEGETHDDTHTTYLLYRKC